MKKHVFLVLVAAAAFSSSNASPSIEGLPVGYKKYYKNGYIEIKCDVMRPSDCVVSVQFKRKLIKKKIDLKNYGYINAWEPIGAFLDDGIGRGEPVSFYFSTECVDEDYALSRKSPGEVKCTIYGRISEKDVHLKNVEVTSVTDDDFSISRGLTPLNP